LGKQFTICNAEIAWYKGNERVNEFKISTSNDGVNFVNLISGESTGLTTDFEKYDMKNIKARYIKITVTGNSQNNWISISEVKVNGKANVIPAPTPTPTPTPSPNPSPTPVSDFNFAAVGDWSCNSRASETIANMKNKQPELILALGDFSYKSSPDCWIDKISDIQDIIRITIGNHDAAEEESSALEEQYLEHFNLNKPYYSFDLKNAHFIMLSSQLAAKKGNEQYTFVDNDLKKASQNKNIKWIIVSLHKPLYTSPSKHSAETDFRNVYHPLFDKYGVDVVLQAHNHNYQRSFPLSYNTQSSSSPTITDNSKSVYKDPKGPIFVLAGTGGKSLYDLAGKLPYIVTQLEEYGIFEVKITNGGTKLTGTFYTNSGNQVKDSFTIQK
jgi:predicted MPP superfamily phosphohydrolase